MNIQISSTIENLFRNCLDGTEPVRKEVWTADILETGFQSVIKKSMIDVNQCLDIIKKNKKYPILEIEFEKLGINDEMVLEQFTKTYLYLLQDTSFETTVFKKTCDAMYKILSEPTKYYFFVPLYNFDTNYDEIIINEFKITKITPFHFDKITGIYLDKGSDEPTPKYVERTLKYVLEFSGVGNPVIDPKEIYNSFLNALRITDTGTVIFGNAISYNPDGWQGLFAPGIKDSIESSEGYFLKQDKINTLKENLKLLKLLDSNSDNVRYLIYSIRRFNYIYQSKLVEDDITDLMISLETLLNFEPYEVTDKTSLRAAILLETNDHEKLNCKKFIKKCYGIRSEIVHGKKRKTKILKNDYQLTDAEIRAELQNYVRTAITRMLNLQLTYNSQIAVLEKIDEYTLDRSISLF